MKVYILGILFLLIPFKTLGSGLSVSPAVLKVEINNSEQVSKFLTISNPTSQVMLFEAYTDIVDANKIFSITPESFTLEAGENKKIQILINGQKIKTDQIITGEISIVGKTLSETQVNVLAGAKVPISITITSDNGKNTIPKLTGILILLCSVVLSVLYRRKIKPI